MLPWIIKTLLLALLFPLLILSCGYSIHKRADLPFQEIYLRKVENLTLEPGIQDKVMNIAYKILSENGFNLKSTAERILDLQIKNYRLITLSEIGLITVEYEIQMEVKAILYDKDGNKLKEFSPSTAFRTVFKTSRQLQRVIADRDLAIESLIRDICEDMTRRLIFSDATDSKISK